MSCCRNQNRTAKTKPSIFQRLFLHQDFYAEKIRFNFKGKERVTSFTGAAMTFLVKLFVAVFLVLRVCSLAFDQTASVRVTEKRLDISGDVDFGNLN